MIKQGVKIYDMTMADRVRSLAYIYGQDGYKHVAEMLGCSNHYAKKHSCPKTYSESKLELKWRKRMTKDLTRGFIINDGMIFHAFTKSKEYVDVTNECGMLERISASDVLCHWREFYGVGSRCST